MKILLARLRLIGDVAFTTPLVRALRQRYPGAHLAYLVEPAAAPVVLGNPHLNDVIVVPLRRGAGRVIDDLAVARRLRRERFDVVIDLHGGPRSAFLSWASGAPKRIGYPVRGRSWMYTDVVPRHPDLAPRHCVRNQWDLLAPLGVEAPDPAKYPMEMADDPAAAARVDERLRSAGVGANNPLVVVHVSAGNPFRRWPAESFTTLAVQLVERQHERRVILTSGPSEATAARQIADVARQRLGPLAPAIVDVDDLNLTELRALIARAAVYIGGDSGPVHVAATTATPIVELLGPTLAERSRPWRDPRRLSITIDAGPLPCRPCAQRHCEPGDFRCLTMISAETVLDAAERALGVGVNA